MADSVDLQTVFIAGCGRSGTSYLRSIVDSHPDIYIPSESLFITDYLRFCERVPVRLKNWLFFREPQLRCWYEGPEFPFTNCAQAIAEVHRYMALQSGARIWGQKTPRFVRHMGLLDASFPGATWILVHRDPRAVVASMLRSGQHTHSVKAACGRWIRDNKAVFAYQANPADNVLVLSYESLIEDFDTTVRKVFRFLGVAPVDRDWIEGHAQPVFFSRSRFTINTVREGMVPDAGRLDDWKAYLQADDVAYIENVCGDLMSALGYERSVPRGRRRGPPREWRRRLSDVAILVRYLRKWPEYLFYTALRYTLFRFFALIGR